MPRPRLRRRIRGLPNSSYFKPAGVRMIDLAESELSMEEFEAIRLIDYEETPQEEAAKKMQISQPTLSRMLKSARKKIAHALVKGHAIRIEGGNFKIVKRKTLIIHKKRPNLWNLNQHYIL